MITHMNMATKCASGFPTFSSTPSKYAIDFLPGFVPKHRNKDPCRPLIGLRPRRTLEVAVRLASDESKCKLETPKFTVTQLPPVPKAEFYVGSVLHVEDVAPGTRCITVEAEISRELVHREDAYTRPGQLGRVRVKGGDEVRVPVCSAPFSRETNWSVLYKMRGDMPSGAIKLPNSTLSVKAPLQLHVSDSHSPVLYALQQGDEVEVGPFEPTGLDLRPVLFISGFPTVLFFASGRGIAVVRAIIESREGDNGSISLGFREQVRLFYSAPDPSLLAYKGKFEEWEEKKVKIRTTVTSAAGNQWDGFVGSFTDLWNEDDIEYDPDTTAAIVCVDYDARDEIKELLSDAGISEKQVVYWDAAF